MRVHLPRVSGPSLNKINRGIVASLGQEFEFVESGKTEILLQHYVSKINPRNRYQRTVLIQPVDGTKIAKVHIDRMNEYDVVLAPAEASKELLIQNGVTKPIQIVPNWYEEELLTCGTEFFDARYSTPKYTFYSESTGIYRKNVENLLRHFLEEFAGKSGKENVRLILKLTTNNEAKIKRLEKIISEYPDPPEVDILNSFLNENELNSLRKGINCYICLSFMEGFCIPLLNSAVIGKDIICLDTKISGYSDFIDRSNGYLVKCRRIPIDTKHESLLIYEKGSYWEEADYQDYRRGLRMLSQGEYLMTKDRDFSMYSYESVMNQYGKYLRGEDYPAYVLIEPGRDTDYILVSRELRKLGIAEVGKFSPNKIQPAPRIKRHDISPTSSAHEELETHVQALKRLRKSQLDWVLICEDDCKVLDSSPDIQEILENAPRDWDVLYLGGLNHYHPPIKIDDNFYRCHFSFNAHAYLIKTSFIPKVLQQLEKRAWECDVTFAHMQEMKIGNWYGVYNDVIIPSGKYKKRFIKSYDGKIGKSATGAKVEIVRLSTDPEIKGIRYQSVQGSSGYAEAAKDYILGLDQMGLPVKVDHINLDNSTSSKGKRNHRIAELRQGMVDHDRVILHTVCDRWPPEIIREKKRNFQTQIVGMTVWETDKIPREWIGWMNSVDKIIVPCQWNADVFKKCGVNKPIGVIPHIYKEVTPEPFELPIPKDHFVFYTIGQWTQRKGIKETIQAYLQAFTKNDPVTLVVKTFDMGYSMDQKRGLQQKINNLLQKYQNPPHVLVIYDELIDHQISYLHSIGDCYVTLTKSEGWGLGMFDALGEGNPVICTGFGGQLDFTIGPYIDYKLGIVDMAYPWYSKDQSWAYPDKEHAASLMKEVYHHYPSYKEKAVEHSHWIKDYFSAEKVTQQLVKFLKS